MRKRLLTKITVLAATLSLTIGALTGCGAGSAQAKESDELNSARTIRIADQPYYYTAKVALQKGFLAEEFGDEYKFEINLFENGTLINEAITAGEVDLAAYGDTPAIQGFANGIDVQVISTLWVSDNAYALVAGANSGVNSTADLKGKKLAFRAGTTTHQLLLSILDREGLSESDVTLVNLNTAEGIAALAKGEVDTIIGQQPFDEVLEQTGGKIIVTNKDYHLQPIFALAQGTFAKNNPDTVSRILKVYDKTNKWIAENVDEATKIVSDFNGLDPEGCKQYYETRDWVIGWDPQFNDSLTESIQFALDNNNITSLFDQADLVNTSYLENAGLYSK